MADHYWQKEDQNGDICDDHIITRFDDDPELFLGVTANEYLYFVVTAICASVVVASFFWYLFIYRMILVPYEFDKQGVIVATLSILCVLSGYLTNQKMMKVISTAKRGKPRNYLFHASAWWVYRKFGIKPKFIFYSGSLDIKRGGK